MGKFLNELEARNLLSKYDISMAQSMLANSGEEAAQKAKQIGLPVVMKILSADILHKTEAKCVFVGVKTKEEAIETYETIVKNAKAYDEQAKIDGVLVQEMAKKGLEVIIGMKRDPQFGPIIMVGSGGIYVEVFKDIALRLLPLTHKDVRKMISETKLSQVIKGARGIKYDEEALVDTLMQVSDLVLDNPNIEEIDINPMFLYEKGCKGVDALIKLE